MYYAGEFTYENFMHDASCVEGCCETFWAGFFPGIPLMWLGFSYFFVFSLYYFAWIPMVSTMLLSDFDCDDGACIEKGMVFASIISIDIIVCIYAAMYTYWRYTSGLIIATLAVVCLWATFSSSLWPHERLYS